MLRRQAKPYGDWPASAPCQRPLGAATISEIYFGICSKVRPRPPPARSLAGSGSSTTVIRRLKMLARLNERRLRQLDREVDAPAWPRTRVPDRPLSLDKARLHPEEIGGDTAKSRPRPVPSPPGQRLEQIPKEISKWPRPNGLSARRGKGQCP